MTTPAFTVMRILRWNSFMAAFVFLPVYLVGRLFQSIVLYGENPEGQWGLYPGYALYTYVVFILPVIAGSFVCSLALLLIPAHWPEIRRWLAAFLLSSLLPVTVLLVAWISGGNPSIIMESFWGIIAGTIVYGFFSSRKFVSGQSGTTGGSNHSAAENATG